MYGEFAYSTEKEAELLLEEVKAFLDEYIDYQNVPWQSSKISAVRHAKVRAIQQYLGILSDGRATPLSALDRLRFGNPKAKLCSEIASARKQALHITEVLTELGDTELMNRDVALMQFFILEQFSPFKRYVLMHRLFTFSVSSALPISPLLWTTCWAFAICSLLFWLYWVLQWGISNGSVTLEQWGINFAFALLEDIFAVQGIRCYALFVLSMMSIDPQLRYIYRVLNRVAVSYTQDELENNLGEIKVVQHLSGACRVSRMKIGLDLSAAKILRHMDDVDIEVCRLNRDVGMSTLAVVIVSIPVYVGALDFILGEIALDSALPAMFSMFLLGNYFLLTLGVIALVIPYLLLGGFYTWRHFVVIPAIRKIKSLNHEIQHGSFFASDDKDWIVAKRKHRKISFREYVSSLGRLLYRTLLLTGYYMNSPFKIVADFTEVFSNHAKKRKAREIRQWQLLNIDQNLHGRIDDEKNNRARLGGIAERMQINNRKISLKEGRNFHLEKLRQLVASLPEPIQAMQQGTWTHSWDRKESKPYMTECLNRYIFGLQPHTDADESQLTLLAPGETPPVHPIHYSTEEVLDFRHTYTIYKDVDTALNRMLRTYQRLVADGEAKKVRNKYARYLSQITDYGECDALIHISDYIIMMNEVWELFYPAGVEMDEEEQTEVVHTFSSWMIAEGYHAAYEELDVEDGQWWDKYSGQDSNDRSNGYTADSPFYANFGNFCQWFKTMVERIEQYRDVDRRIIEEKKASDKMVAIEHARIVAKALAERARKLKALKENAGIAEPKVLAAVPASSAHPRSPASRTFRPQLNDLQPLSASNRRSPINARPSPLHYSPSNGSRSSPAMSKSSRASSPIASLQSWSDDESDSSNPDPRVLNILIGESGGERSELPRFKSRAPNSRSAWWETQSDRSAESKDTNEP